MSGDIEVDVPMRNPHGFFCIAVMPQPDRPATCGRCGCTSVVTVIAPAGTPEIVRLVFEEIPLEDRSRDAERVKRSMGVMPWFTFCPMCKDDQRHNWHFIEFPDVDLDGRVLRDGLNRKLPPSIDWPGLDDAIAARGGAS